MSAERPSVPISEVCELIVDCVNKTAPVVDCATPYKMIRTTNVRDGWVDTINVRYVEEETYKIWTRRGEPKNGDVILTREAPLGEVGLLRDARGVFLGQRLVMYRANPKKLDNRFLLYSLLGHDLQAQIKAFGSGSTVEHMRVPDCEKLILQLPPLETQQKIGSILSTYDDLIENNTRRIKVLEEMARMIYREWFVNFRFPGHENVKMVDSPLGLIPEGWEVGRLDDALILQRGFDLPKKDRFEDGDVPVYAATGLNGKHIEAKVKGPCVITGRSGSLGTVIYVDEDFWPLNTTLWIKEFKKSTPIFAYYLLSEMGLSQYNAGAAVPTLNRNDVHGLQVVLPPRNLLEVFESHLTSIFKFKKVIEKKNQNLRQTRDLLLPKLISGEVEV